MDLAGYVICRSATRSRTQVGDPSKDIFEYTMYSFCSQKGDFEVEQYCGPGFEPANIISRKENLFELGKQYKYTLSDKKDGIPVYVIKGKVKNNYILFSNGHSDCWISRLEIRSHKPLPLILSDSLYNKYNDYYLKIE